MTDPRIFTVKMSDVARCPKGSLLPDHYRDDGSCRCRLTEAEIIAIAHAYMAGNLDASNWAFLYPDEENWESPDCDVMSKRFRVWLKKRVNLDSTLVHVTAAEPGRMYSDHWFVEVGGWAVDWTAKQFYNVPQPPIDPGTIRCPLIFKWPGEYPLAFVSFNEERVSLAERVARSRARSDTDPTWRTNYE